MLIVLQEQAGTLPWAPKWETFAQQAQVCFLDYLRLPSAPPRMAFTGLRRALCFEAMRIGGSSHYALMCFRAQVFGIGSLGFSITRVHGETEGKAELWAPQTVSAPPALGN